MDPVASSRFRAVFAKLSPAQQRTMRAMCLHGGRAEAAHALYRSEATIRNTATAAYAILAKEGFFANGRSLGRLCYLLGTSDTCQELTET